MKNKKSRRDFMKKGALAAGAFYIVPRHVLGKGFKAPSDKLNLAAIGAGGKGRSDIMNAWNKGSENVVALCDIDLNQASAAMKKFPKAKIYRDFREMLDNQNDIDAVTISTPDHNHGVAAMSAMQKGLHVYVQKPLTHNIYEARMLTEGARKYKIVSQMGNQGASNPGQQQMIEWFGKGMIGNVDAAHIWTDRPVWPQGIPVPSEKKVLPDSISAKNWDTWIGPAKEVEYHPLYHPFKWRGWWDFGTGALGDMGCHLIDPAFRVLQLGYPTEVEGSVGQIFLKDWNPEYIPEGCPPSSSVKVQFGSTPVNDKPIAMYWTDGGIRPFHPNIIPADHPLGDDDSSNGVMLIGDKGVMTCGTYGRNPKIYLNSGDIIEMPKGYDGGLKNHKMSDYGHQVSWVEAIKGGFGSKEHKALTSSFDYSGPLTETVIMGNLAIRSYQESTTGSGRNAKYEGRKKLLWDGENMKVTNYDEANKFVSRKYRDGWKLI